METPHLDKIIERTRKDAGLRAYADLAAAELALLKQQRAPAPIKPPPDTKPSYAPPVRRLPQPVFVVGDLVRYDKGSTAFMRVEENVWKPEVGKWAVVGNHVCKEFAKVWAMEDDCSLAQEADRIRMQHTTGARQDLLGTPVSGMRV